MVQSDIEASVHATRGAASLNGVGSPWAVLAWAALRMAIVVSFRPAIPVIWGDTPSFMESALQTLEAGRPTVAGGRDPGYPVFLAETFALGGDLATVMRLQQAAWTVLMLVLAATAHAATRNAGGSKPAALDEMADRRSVAADFCSKINHERKSKLSTTLSASVISVVNSRRP